VRGEARGQSMSDYLIQEIADKPNIAIRLRTQVTGARGTASLEELEVADGLSGQVSTERADALFILIGAEPHTRWLPDAIERDDRGYILTGRDLSRACGCQGHRPGPWPLERQPYLLETSVPGVLPLSRGPAHQRWDPRQGQHEGAQDDPGHQDQAMAAQVSPALVGVSGLDAPALANLSRRQRRLHVPRGIALPMGNDVGGDRVRRGSGG
jgi:hypothetical protein